jgi:hypothetical protein
VRITGLGSCSSRVVPGHRPARATDDGGALWPAAGPGFRSVGGTPRRAGPGTGDSGRRDAINQPRGLTESAAPLDPEAHGRATG